MANNTNLYIIVGLIVVAVVAFNQGWFDGVFNDNTGTGSDVVIQGLNEQTLKMSAVDEYNPTDAVVASFITFEDGVRLSDEDGTITVKRTSKYDVLVNASGWVSVTDSFTVGADPVPAKQYKLADFMNLTGRIDIRNEDASANTNSARYDVEAGDTPNIEITFEGISKDVFPGGIIVFEGLSTVVEDLELSIANFAETTEPSQYDSVITSGDTWSFTVPKIVSSTNIVGSLNLDIDDDASAGDYNITYTIYDSQFDLDSKSGLITGQVVQDSDEQDVGESQVTGQVFITVN